MVADPACPATHDGACTKPTILWLDQEVIHLHTGTGPGVRHVGPGGGPRPIC